MIVLLLLPVTCLAGPWGDYELAIGDGYSIIVFTEGTVCAKNRRTVLNLGDYQATISQYATTKQHIFIRDYTRFFILDKSDDSVMGPLSESDFAKHPAVVASGPLKWKEPRNPHPYRDVLF